MPNCTCMFLFCSIRCTLVRTMFDENTGTRRKGKLIWKALYTTFWCDSVGHNHTHTHTFYSFLSSVSQFIVCCVCFTNNFEDKIPCSWQNPNTCTHILAFHLLFHTISSLLQTVRVHIMYSIFCIHCENLLYDVGTFWCVCGVLHYSAHCIL